MGSFFLADDGALVILTQIEMDVAGLIDEVDAGFHQTLGGRSRHVAREQKDRIAMRLGLRDRGVQDTVVKVGSFLLNEEDVCFLRSLQS